MRTVERLTRLRGDRTFRVERYERATTAAKDQVIAVAGEYGSKLDAAKAGRGWFMDGWAELMTLCQACRMDRRITRGYLKEDFDRATGWVDELVPPPSVKGKPAAEPLPAGGTA